MLADLPNIQGAPNFLFWADTAEFLQSAELSAWLSSPHVQHNQTPFSSAQWGGVL